MSLVMQEPVRLIQEIDCSDIHPFKTIEEAKLAKKLKGKNYMIVKEQNENLWYVMPNANGLLVGSCFSEY